MGTLNGTTAIITGAGSGIGKGIAVALAQEGAQLILTGRTRETLEATAAALPSAAVHIIPADVTVEADVIELFTQTMQLSDHLDLVINNAGVFDGGPLDELSLAAWEHVLAVNLTGPFLCTREAMKIMKRQKGGRIINIGSISAHMPRMNSAPYATSKHGLVGLTKAAALEGRDYGISVSCLHPGNVITERHVDLPPTDVEPHMTPAELAVAVVTMASLPPHINMLEAIILPVTQAYLGRG
ncbi:MAG: SDR family oxidoreductase [Herpetosiphonaceae bacterium]|nr:SDR family oxidoreductase [Herpetosiphonaceae bacterium]